MGYEVTPSMYSAKTKRPLRVFFPSWGVAVLESHHDRDFRMDLMRNDFLKVLYVLDGHGTFVAGNRTMPIEKADVILVPPRAPHLLRDDPERRLSILFLCVQDDVWRSFPELAGEAARFRHAALGSEVQRLLRRLFVEQSLGRPGAPALMTGLALEALGTIARYRERRSAGTSSSASTAEARVRAYARELRERFYEVEKIDNVAERLGMSRRTFTRLFRLAAGRSWLDELHALRLKHACTLLLREDRTVLWIALECGFEDVSTFYRVFRKSEGVSPRQWRESKGR